MYLDLADFFNFILFIHIANNITKPFIIIWLYEDTLNKFNPFPNIPIIPTPIHVPTIEPEPPIILVPPSTTAAIASNSAPSPTVGEPDAKRDDSIIPANAVSSPASAYTFTITLFTFTPHNLAASSFPPTACTWRPKLVLFNRKCPAITTIIIIITGIGIGPIYPLPSILNASVFTDIGLPPVNTKLAPLIIVNMAKVTMNGGSFCVEIIAPFMTPKIVPIANASIIPTHIGAL